MKNRARIVSGLAALAALFLAPFAEASLSRASSAERAIGSPALTLTVPAPEPSEFSLFEGHELAAAAAETKGPPSFHPLAAVSLLSENARLELEPALTDSYPKTRIGGLRLFSQRVFLASRLLSVEVRWGCESFSCGIAEGVGSWLSQDPLGDVDSPNLYGLVGMRPHERTDPLGLFGWSDIKSGAEHFAIGAVNKFASVANFVLHFGDPDVQSGLTEEAKSIARDAQDPTLGPSPDQRLLQRQANQIHATKERFLNASVAEQQEMIGGGAANIVMAAAPFAKGRVAPAAAVGTEGAAGRSVGAMARDPMSGPVEFEISPSWTPEQIAHGKAAVESANRALQSGALSPTGRVSTKGSLQRQASRARVAERARAEEAGQAYRGVAGHGPDMTWTGKAIPPEWQDEDWIVNSSLGAQARRYPLGYKPTEFILNEPSAPVVKPAEP